jgi:hypothetical protein
MHAAGPMGCRSVHEAIHSKHHETQVQNIMNKPKKQPFGCYLRDFIPFFGKFGLL